MFIVRNYCHRNHPLVRTIYHKEIECSKIYMRSVFFALNSLFFIVEEQRDFSGVNPCAVVAYCMRRQKGKDG